MPTVTGVGAGTGAGVGVGVGVGFFANAEAESARHAQITAKVFMYPIRTFTSDRTYSGRNRWPKNHSIFSPRSTRRTRRSVLPQILSTNSLADLILTADYADFTNDCSRNPSGFRSSISVALGQASYSCRFLDSILPIREIRVIRGRSAL